MVNWQSAEIIRIISVCSKATFSLSIRHLCSKFDPSVLSRQQVLISFNAHEDYTLITCFRFIPLAFLKWSVS
jgi:hypothetical protein